jgi:hypothetical protein
MVLALLGSLILTAEDGTTLFNSETSLGHSLQLEANCNLVIASVSGSGLRELSTQICNP